MQQLHPPQTLKVPIGFGQGKAYLVGHAVGARGNTGDPTWGSAITACLPLGHQGSGVIQKFLAPSRSRLKISKRGFRSMKSPLPLLVVAVLFGSTLCVARPAPADSSNNGPAPAASVTIPGPLRSFMRM